MPQLLRLMVIFGALSFITACATPPPASEPEAVRAFEELNDPLEPWNRAMHQLDQGLDTVLFKPVISVYETVIPELGRKGVTNLIRNFRSPITLMNDLLQGEGKRASITIGRFVVNSTIGVLGLFDIADRMGMPYHSEDFGQTLAVWGIGDGPFLYVPILGPSGVRDLSGYAIDTFTTDPMAWVAYADNPLWWQVAYFYGVALDAKYRVQPVLEDLKVSSIDYYAALRAAYRQNRDLQIRNGTPAAVQDLEDFDYDEDGDPFSKRDTIDDKITAEIAAK